MGEALRTAGDEPGEPGTQLSAAVACLRQALRLGDDRRAAIDLLAADALLTSACDAVAMSGAQAATVFAGKVADALAGLVDEEGAA